jgi:phospholipase C
MPYELHVDGEVDAPQRVVRLFFRNSDKAGAFFQVRSGDCQTGPWTYSVGAGDETLNRLGTSGTSSYDFSLFGPNGFLRPFAGGLEEGSAYLTVNAIYDEDSDEGIVLVIRNHGSSAESEYL